MFRVLVLIFACFGMTLGDLSGDDEFYREPACEDVRPGGIHMDLSNAGLTAIRKPIASSPLITCLNLAGNRISTIAPNAFDGLPELSYLNLAGSVISPQNFNFSKLKTLVLDGISMDSEGGHNAMASMYANPEYSLPQLEKLALRNYSADNQYLIVQWLQILDIPNLTHLYLSDNRLTGNLDNVEDRIIFSKTQNLTHCYLDNNRIFTLDESAMPNVRHLSLNGNSIESLGTKSCVWFVHCFIIRGMNNLEYLSLAHNGIRNIDSDAFESMASLRFLNLSANWISDFPSNASVFLVNLKDLILDYNPLSEIPDICALKELRSLSLVGNRIASVNETSFCGLQKLSAIYLGRNGLTTINDRTFASVPALRVLDLSWNQLVSLPENWIAPPNFIMKLHLDGNKFQDIESMSLKGIDGLQYLSVGHNPMRTLRIMSLTNLPNSTEIDFLRDSLPTRGVVMGY